MIQQVIPAVLLTLVAAQDGPGFSSAQDIFATGLALGGNRFDLEPMSSETETEAVDCTDDDGPGCKDANALYHIAQQLASAQDYLEDTGANTTTSLNQLQSINAQFPVLNYGCYCFIREDTTIPVAERVPELAGPLPGFGGQPVDELDKLCRDLYLYQKCIQIDNLNDRYNSPCELNDAYVYITESATGTGEVACTEEDYKPDTWDFTNSRQNVADCTVDLCRGDTSFAKKVVDLYNSGTFRRTPSYFSMVQKGTYESTCQKHSGTSGSTGGSSGSGSSSTSSGGSSVESHTECCGIGLDRRPFASGHRECCAEDTDAPFITAFGMCME